MKLCIHYFAPRWDKTLDRGNLRTEAFILAQFERKATFREVIAARTGSSWSYCVHSVKAERDESSNLLFFIEPDAPAHGMVPPIHRAGLSISKTLLQYLHRYFKRFASYVLLRSVNLTIYNSLHKSTSCQRHTQTHLFKSQHYTVGPEASCSSHNVECIEPSFSFLTICLFMCLFIVWAPSTHTEVRE